MNHIKWQIFCCCWPNMCGLWSNCWPDRLPCGRSMKPEERGGGGGGKEGDQQSSRSVYACWWPTVSIESRSSSQSRGQIRRDSIVSNRSAMRCDALRSNERTIDRSSASKYRFRPYLMINIGNRTYLNLPVIIIIVSACSCICNSSSVSVSVAGSSSCCCTCVLHGSDHACHRQGQHVRQPQTVAAPTRHATFLQRLRCQPRLLLLLLLLP